MALNYGLVNVYIYIYIYIRGRPHLVGTFYPKISLFPQFYSKIWPRKTPTNLWGFFMFPSFLFFLLSAFFCLSFLFSLCFSTSWGLKRYPPGGVSGIYIYICRRPRILPRILGEVLVISLVAQKRSWRDHCWTVCCIFGFIFFWISDREKDKEKNHDIER